MARYPACSQLRKERLKKNPTYTKHKLATLLRIRFGRKRVKSDGAWHRVDADFIEALEKGKVYAPDTLRSRIANILNIPESQAFPEYMIRCERLREKRQQAQLTQAALAALVKEKAGRKLRESDICSYEGGTKYCHPATRAAIAQALEVAESELFPEYGEAFSAV